MLSVWRIFIVVYSSGKIDDRSDKLIDLIARGYEIASAVAVNGPTHGGVEYILVKNTEEPKNKY